MAERSRSASCLFSGLAGWRSPCGAHHRRHGSAEEGQTFGRGRSALCDRAGQQANCQTLVSLTLARHEVPVPIALRLYLPEVWTEVARRLARAGCRSYGGGSARSPSLSSRSERLCGGTPNADAIAPHAV